VKSLAASAILALACAGQMSANAVVFASLGSPDNLATFSVSGSTETITYSSTGLFNFQTQPPSAGGIPNASLPPPLQNNNNFDATISESLSTSTLGVNFGGTDIIPGWSGTITISLTAAQATALCASFAESPTCLGGFASPTLLSATFSGGAMTFTNGSGTASLNMDDPPLAVAFASQILVFPAQIEDDITLSLGAPQGSLTLSGGTSGTLCESTTGPPPTTCGGNQLDVQGQFLANPTPNSIPEPGTLMLIGGALVGLGVLGRKRFVR
jgi:hypothetical protein